MSMPSKKLFLIGLAAVLLAGCATFEEVGKKIAESQVKADEALAQQSQMRRTGAVVRMRGAKLAGEEVSVKRSGQLPQVFSRPFSYLSAHQPLSAVLGEVGRRTGLATAIQPEDTNQPRGATPTTAVAIPGLPNFNGGQNVPIAVDWSGDLKGLLDYLASTTKMFWKYEDGRIYFFRTETRTFHVFLPGGKRAVKSSITLASIGKGESKKDGEEGNTVTSSIEIDAYDAIVKSIQAIVSTAEGVTQQNSPGQQPGQQGASVDSRNVVANPALGIVTVTATPVILDRVASYIKSLNERFAQNVMIGVKVYNLTVNSGVDISANLNAAYASLAGKYGVSTSGVGLVGGSPNKGLFVLDKLSGRWNGSQLLLQALQTLGDVQEVTSGQVVTANGQPGPLQVGREISYISGYSADTQENGITTKGGPQSSKLTLGFTGNFLPFVLGDNRILLQYQITLNTLLDMGKSGPANQQIDTPLLSIQNIQQQAFLKDGQSIVLLGFESDTAESNNEKSFFGIGKSANTKKNMMVIVMEVYSGK